MNLLLVRSYGTGNMIQKSAKFIRNEFLDYFGKDLNHTFIRSSPVRPINDETVTFVNAGMNQFKGIFLDCYDPSATRVTNSQKCIRISGKHNDLNVVGNDMHHHTFFEMLGNWSFGDYYKEEACRYAWDLLTKNYGIRKEILYVTYFAGDKTLGLEPDLECKDIWLSIGVPNDKVLPFGLKDNFWEMGISGPCGPCTEIHVDHTKRANNQAARINKGFADLTELWNIVFIQYERLPNGSIVPLSKHHVDTGMGLERLVSLLQEKMSNYDTDLFQPLINSIQKYTNAPEYKGRFQDDEYGLDNAYRILADHSRMITIALADGMIPEKVKKLRRILRKTISIGKKVFKKEGILSELSYSVVDNLGDVYPELQKNIKKVQKIIEFETELFKHLRSSSDKEWKKLIEIQPKLEAKNDWMIPSFIHGYKYLQNALKESKETKKLTGDIAMKLYDTYGLSTETITELAQIESLYFEEEAFKNVLEDVKYQSKLKLHKYSDINLKKMIELLKNNHIPETNDSFKYEYIYDKDNYQYPIIESKIVGLIINGNLILNEETVNLNASNNKNEFGIILDKTLYYSLEGGQASDKGLISVKNLTFIIHHTRKINNYVIHFGKLSNGLKNPNKNLKIGENCKISINLMVRKGLMQHHTGTHLLHASLQKIMPVFYPFKSNIFSDLLKFRCNFLGEKLYPDQLEEIEKYVNDVIQADVPITTRILNSLELLSEDDITLIPEENYPYKDIRVVEIDTHNLKSKEACCGTHVPKTGELEYFCISNYFLEGANFTIEAIVGSCATAAKLLGERIQDKISNLEHKQETGEITYETFQRVKNDIQKEINSYKNTSIPFLIKIKCLRKLKDLDKNIWMKLKEIEMHTISEDIKRSIDSGNSIIVHYLRKCPKYLSLHEIVSHYPNVPIMIIAYQGERVKARCSVPQKVVSKIFNAQTWMREVLEIFNANYSRNENFNPLLFASMKSTRSSNYLIEEAIMAAINFANINVKQV